MMDKAKRADYARRYNAAHRAERAERARRYHAEHRAEIAERARRYNYDLSPEEFSHLLGLQMGCCKICGQSLAVGGQGKDKCCVDHGHHLKKGEPGFVRGLLCAQCNKGLGFFYDTPAILSSATAYLTNARTPGILPLT